MNSNSSSGGGVTGNVRKLNDSVVNDSNANTKSSSYKRVTLETDNDDNEDDNSSTTFSQINAKHNALSMFLNEYKNNQDGMLKKLESYAASKYHEDAASKYQEDEVDDRVDDNRTGRSSSRRSSSKSSKRTIRSASSSPPKRSVSPQRSYSPPKRSSGSSQYQDVQSRYLDPNPRYSPGYNSNPRLLSPFFSRLTHSKNPNPWVPNKNLSYHLNFFSLVFVNKKERKGKRPKNLENSGKIRFQLISRVQELTS
jgi:hypothetical protein